MRGHDLPQPGTHQVLRFGDIALDMRRSSVSRGGHPVPLRPKAYSLLCYFAGNAGRVLSKGELHDGVWPGVVVTDDSLSQCVNELRAALDDRGQRLIKTVPRRGYLFDARVEVDGEAVASTQAPDVTDSVAPRRSRRRWLHAQSAGVSAVAALAVATAAAWMHYRRSPSVLDAELAQRRSIAVLPLTDLSEPKAPHFAEGVTDELITDLGRIPNTTVIARASSAAAGRGAEVDVREVGRRLGVQHVVTGSVMRHGEHVQVNAQLARTDTGAVLWTERFSYDRSSDWNWRLHISQRIAATLDLKLHRTTIERAKAQGYSGEGIDRWLQGQFIHRATQSRAQMVAAREHFEAAVRAEPRSVNALSGLSLTHVCLVLFRWSADREADIAMAKVMARRALDIDPEHPVALRAMGQALMFGGEFEEARRTFARMLAVSPSNPDAHRGMAAVLYLSGQWEKVAPYVEQALRLSPLDNANRWRAHDILAGSLFAMGRHDEAHEQWRLAVEADRSVPHLHFALGAVQALRGHVEQARQSIAQGLALNPGYSVAKAATMAPSFHPRYVAHVIERQQQGLRVAGLPEGDMRAATRSDRGTVKR